MTQPGPCDGRCPQEAGNPVRERRHMRYSQPGSRSCFPRRLSVLRSLRVSVPLKRGESPTWRGFGERRDGESSTDGEAGEASPRPPRVCPHYSVLRMFALAANCKY